MYFVIEFIFYSSYNARYSDLLDIRIIIDVQTVISYTE